MFTVSPKFRRRAERGAAAALVAILLGGGVLLGASALAVDVGNMMFERRQLQNGADATAAKLANICAKNLANCNATTTVTALNVLNNLNGSDRRASMNTTRPGTVNGQCGRVPGAPNMPPCASATSDANITSLVECPALPDFLRGTTVKYVETYTLTENTNGTHLLPSFFLQTDGTPVGACARVAWGPPKSGTTLPLTFSFCEYEEALAKVGYGDNPINPADKYKGETALAFKYATAPTPGDPCPGLGHTGMDAPGGFGWLDQTGCQAQINADGWVNVDTGKSGPDYCIKAGDLVFIPIFDCVSKIKLLCDNISGGANTWYHIKGFGAFYITGIESPARKEFLSGYPGTTASKECKKEATDNKSCIYGMFVKGFVDYSPGGIDPTGTYTDVIKIVPAG